MNLENQVVSLELAKKLKELGVKQESLFYWNCDDEGYTSRIDQENKHGQKDRFFIGDTVTFTWLSYSAFTASELAEMLPNTIEAESGDELYLQLMNDDGEWAVYYDEDFPIFTDKSLVEALAACLIHLIKNNLIQL